MKKTLCTAILLGSIMWAHGQTSESEKKTNTINETGKNELKVNLLSSVLGLPEISYERLLEDNMSVGLSLGAGIGNQSDDLSDYRFLAIPHYRLYFGKKRAAGFFIEGSAAVASLRDRYYYYYDSNGAIRSNEDSSTKVHFGLGAAVGAKFLTRNGFTGEIYGGAGRLFGNNRTSNAYPRFGITLGKRF